MFSSINNNKQHPIDSGCQNKGNFEKLKKDLESLKNEAIEFLIGVERQNGDRVTLLLEYQKIRTLKNSIRRMSLKMKKITSLSSSADIAYLNQFIEEYKIFVENFQRYKRRFVRKLDEQNQEIKAYSAPKSKISFNTNSSFSPPSLPASRFQSSKTRLPKPKPEPIDFMLASFDSQKLEESSNIPEFFFPPIGRGKILYRNDSSNSNENENLEQKTARHNTKNTK